MTTSGGPGEPLVLSVNPGAGSTKLALYRGDALVVEEKLTHPALMERAAARVHDELPARLEAARALLAGAGVARGALAAVAGRGGLLPPVRSGTYLVDGAMLGDLERAVRGEHASNLGAPMASALAADHGCPAFVVDPVSVDELDPVARVSGLCGIERRSLSHALNMRAVARRYAAQLGRAHEDLRLIVVHMGTGVSLSAQREGRMVDVVNPQDEGPFSGDRAGGVPAMAVVDLCAAPGADPRAVRRRLFGDGGLYSHLGTRDAREAIRRCEAGDSQACLVMDAMCYQIAKAAGGLAAALEGAVDAVLLTGGMAHLPLVVEGVRRRVAFVAPVHVFPGEDELRALAEGALRVLRGEERARRYGQERSPEMHAG
jgi:butyrate kinase